MNKYPGPVYLEYDGHMGDPLDEDRYLEFLLTTKWYAHADQCDTGELAYMSLGLAGEGGEFVDLVKKVCRDYGYGEPLGELSEELLDKLRDELGDVLWYMTQLAHLLGLSMEELRGLNHAKLAAREAHGGAGRQHVR